MITQNQVSRSEQVRAWIAADPVAAEYQAFFRPVGLDAGAGTG